MDSIDQYFKGLLGFTVSPCQPMENLLCSLVSGGRPHQHNYCLFFLWNIEY